MNRRQLLLSTLAGLAAFPALGKQVLAYNTMVRNAEFEGVWLSPDWYLPGTHQYSETDVRAIARKVLEKISGAGINAVFLETFLRGYSLVPGVQAGRYSVKPVDYVPGKQGVPLYPHLKWDYRVEVDTVVDPLEIFIQEGRKLGVEIHAWLHLFYWKMDNPSAMLPWHNSPSLWSEMMVEYLRQQATRVTSKNTAELMRGAADLFVTSTDGKLLANLMIENGVDPHGSPMGMLIAQATRDGAARPDFLLIHDARDPFPASRGKQLRPVYLNPANPLVQEKIHQVVASVVAAHPNLAGIHLDHIRYPVDGQGLTPELQIKDGKYNFYNPGDESEMGRYHACKEELRLREETLRKLVVDIRAQVPRPKWLSAAVLPSYYHERDNGRYRLGGYDFASQDWVGWPVDFVVPMLYEMNPYYIRSILDVVGAEQEKRLGSQKIQVYPGVSQIRLGRTGELSAPGWVFFDLKQARDVKLEKKEQTEDMNFGPQ